MREQLFADLETFSEIPIKNGTHAYAEAVEVLLFPYAIGADWEVKGEVKCWDVTSGGKIPDDLYRALTDPEVQLVGQNWGMFDATVLKHAMPEISVPHSRVFDTMACALAHSLPGGLERLCQIFKIADDHAKHKAGKKLIQLFCKPLPKNSKLRRATSETHPKEWQEFIEYAKSDIRATIQVSQKIPKWNYTGGEYDLWVLDQRINQRGVAVDLALARSATLAAEHAKSTLAARTEVLTEGALSSTTKRDALLKNILESYGVHLPDLKMDTIERRLQDEGLPEGLKELLRIRLQATSTSVQKYKALLKATSSDGRLRGLLQFAGALRTARWAGRVFQPQNLPRPTLPQKEIEFAIDVIKAGACELFYEDTMQVLSSTIRSCLIAPEGKKLVVADLANIEGRFAAWLAEEHWKVQYFHDYDQGAIEYDNYVMAYSKSFSIPPEEVMENKKHGDGTFRQIGKVQELMLQYQGRVGAFVTGAATYRIDLEKLSRAVKKNATNEMWEKSAGFLKWAVNQKMSTYGLSDDAFIACDILAMLWREAHPAISSYWQELQEAYVDAVNHPGTWFTCRKLHLRRDGAWLRIKLPSGRFLCYPSPRVEDGVCSYMGMDQYTKKWQRVHTYGGKLFENVTQAGARDVMAHAMPLAEKAGYEIVLTVHDELITEAPDTEGFSVEGLSSILATVPDWAEDLPLAAAGFEAYRYRKD